MELQPAAKWSIFAATTATCTPWSELNFSATWAEPLY